MRRLVLTLFCTVGLGLAGSALAQDGSSPVFLPLSGGARAFALAGASIALADDASASFLNPARLSFLGGRSFTAGYARLVEGIPSERIEVAYGQPVGASIAAPMQRGGAHRLVLGLGLEYQRLELAQGSTYGELTGTVATAFAPLNFASFGASARVLRADSDVEGLEGEGVALDVGASVALLSYLEAGFVAHNLFGWVSYQDQESEDAGRSTSFGLALTRLNWLAAEADLTTEYDGGLSYAFGLELTPGGVLALRGGARYWSSPGDGRLIPTAGAGFKYGAYFVDYSVQIDQQEGLGLVHRVTLGGRP